MHWIRRAWPALAAALAAVALPLAHLAAGETLVWRDTASLFAPVRPLVAEALRRGRLPLWTPLEGLGMPLFAQLIHGVLHPVSLALALLAPQAGLDAAIVLHLAIGAAGAAILARTLGASAGASLLAGVAYGASGWLYGMGSILQLLAGAAAAPWVMAGMRLAGEGRRFGVPLAAVAICVSGFAGDPESALVACLLGLALAAEAGGARGLVRGSLAAALGAGLAAIQLVPAWEFFRDSVRAEGLSAAEQGKWALAPWRLVELAVPGFFSGKLGAVHWPRYLALAGPLSGGAGMPLAASVYLGTTVLWLAAAGARVSRTSRLLAIATLLLFWFALGPALKADAIAARLPLWRDFRYSEKLVGPATLCLTLLAALGADRLAAKPRAWPSIAALLAALAFAISARWVPQALHPAAALLALAALLAGSLRFDRLRPALPALLAALTLAELLAASPYTLLSLPRGLVDEAPLHGLLEASSARVGTPLAKRRYAVDDDRPEVESLLSLQSRMAEPSFNAAGNLEQLGVGSGLWPRRLGRVSDALQRSLGDATWLGLRRFSLTHVVIKRPADEAESRLAAAAAANGKLLWQSPDGAFDLWEVPHRERAFFASTAVSASEEEAPAKLVEAIAKDPEQVIVEGSLPPKLGAGEVLSTLREPERVQLTAKSDSGGLLVMNDAWWRGWTARLDGREVPLLAADALVRAVAFPPGTHQLELRYQPASVRRGAALSLISLLVLLALFWRGSAQLKRAELGRGG